MKTSISSYSFHRLYAPDFTIFDAIKKTKELGMDGFEVTDAGLPIEGDLRTFLLRIKDACDEVGLSIPSYTISGNLLLENQEKEVERLKGQVDMADLLGAPIMRHDVGWAIPDWYKGVRTFDALVPYIAKGVRAVTEYAKSKGIRTCTENHGTFAQGSDRVLKLVNAVNSPNYGLLIDMGNFTCADEYPDLAYGNTIPVAFHAHVKDMFLRSGSLPDPGKGWFKSRGGNYIRCTILGHGDVPVKQCLSMLRDADYQGYVSLEFEGMEPCMEAIEISVENLKRYLLEINT